STGRNSSRREWRISGRVRRSGVAIVGPSCAPLAQMPPRLAAADSTPRTDIGPPGDPANRSRQPTPQYGQTDSPMSGSVGLIMNGAAPSLPRHVPDQPFQRVPEPL